MSEKKSISLWLVPIVAFGFGSTQLSWALFNNAVPIFLQDTYGIKRALVGFIMTWDNIIAFFVQPYIGTLSDRTRTRFGRRFPFIIPGMILGAGFFFLIAVMRNYPLYLFLLTIVIFNLCMALYRSPAVSLMPDLVAKKDHSIGNGIVNLVGGIFSALSLFIAGGLLDAGNTLGGFAFVSIGMILALVVLVSVIREPKEYTEELKVVEDEPTESTLSKLMGETRRMIANPDKSMLFMLLAIMSWFIAWNAIEAFYSTYVAETFLPDLDAEKAAGQASQVLFIFPIVFVVFTIVGGVLGTRIGRRITMRIGLFFMTIAIILASLIEENSFLGIDMDWKTSFTIIFVLAGAAWGLVNVNSIVVIWHHATDNGTGTGLYYAFASAAAILGPTMVGVLMDIKVSYLFPFSITFLIIALIFLFMVKTGEVGDDVHGEDKFLGDALGEMVD